PLAGAINGAAGGALGGAPAYVGNGAYCYANTTSMLLGSVGEAVSPGLIEALSGVGMGALWQVEAQLVFFGRGAPDTGVSKALDLLGFAYEERSSAADAAMPLDELRAALEGGPVAIGPVDLGCLTYAQGARGANGSDHFVLVYGADETEVQLHDPAGYPHVSLPLADLERAWRAEKVGYRRGAFRHWYAPRRRERVSEEALFERAMEWFASIYRSEAPGRSLAGPEAVRAHAAHVRAGNLGRGQVGHLTGFAYRLGARRALDYAAFFGARRPDLAGLKRRQAVAFGRGHTLAVREEWGAVSRVAEEIAVIEEELEAALT
ncbi:MAG TPA: hypothetical protein VFN74_11255, partial [Chloroflexota bacterium]|nr:hypothetical protein [Chloroflexota bacterium]